VLRLHVSRTALTLEGESRQSETTRASVALGVDGWRAGIIAVGKDEAELRAALAEDSPESPARGLRARIVAAAGRLDVSKPELRIVRPGDDPWWDRKWKDPYALRKAESSRRQGPRELLIVEPLSPSSWSPHLIHGLLFYVLWSSAWTRGKTWPPFRRPKLMLLASDDFRGLEYEELTDQLRIVWGERRVELPVGREVGPRPVTALQITYRLSRTLWWAALLLALVLGRPGTEPSSEAVIAAAVAALAIMVSRVAGARAQAELPRRERVA